MDGIKMIDEKQKYQIAFYEVSEIIENMPLDLSNKIPQNFKNFLKENKVENDDFKFTKNDTLATIQLTQEAKSILSLIYRNYLVSEEKKKELYKQDYEIIKAIDEKRLEQYSYENLFKQNTNQKEEKIQETVQPAENAMIEYKKENIFTKIINKIKLWFKRKK